MRCMGSDMAIFYSFGLFFFFLLLYFLYFFFFFQAEDGIRDKLVTGVQTCALPIFRASRSTTGVVSGRAYPGRHTSFLPTTRVIRPLQPDSTHCQSLSVPTYSADREIGRASCRERV